MPKVFIELDYEVVEQAIKAKVPAAVEDVLRRYDMQRLVETAITSDKKEESRSPFSILGSFSSPSPREQFQMSMNAAIKTTLQELATHWLRDHPEMLMAALEKALPRALAKIKLRVEDDNDDY